MNPRRRRRRRHHASNPRRSRRRHYGRRRHRRNPPMGRGIIGQVKAAMPAVGWGAVGFVGTSALPGVASRFMPVQYDKASNPFMYYGVKAASALALGWAVGRFIGSRQGNAVLIGGGINVVGEAIGQFALPALGLSEYLEPGMQEYLEPGSVAYLSPGEPLSGFSGEYDEPVARLNPDNRF